MRQRPSCPSSRPGSSHKRRRRIAAWCGLALGLLLLGLLSRPVFSAAEANWSTYHANAAREGVAASYHLPPLNLSWTGPAGGNSIFASPAIVDGTIFTVAGGVVRARNAVTGGDVWTRDFIGDNDVGGAPIVSDAVYTLATTQFPDLSHRTLLYRLDKASGSTVWTRDPGGTESYTHFVGLTPAGNKILAPRSSGLSLDAINTSDGSLAWSKFVYPHLIAAPGAVSADKAFFPTTDGILALSLATGAQVWLRTVPSPGSWSTPLYMASTDRLFVSIGDLSSGTAGRMMALNAANGQIVWEKTGLEEPYLSTPTPINNNAWIAFSQGSISGTGSVVALDAATGVQIWNVPLPDNVETSVAAANGYVYATCWDGMLRTINEMTGAVADTDVVGPPTDMISTPAIWGERVYVESDGTLYAFQGTADPDDDNDGDPDVTDCQPLNPAVHHGVDESLTGPPLVCQDGIDNDCDGVVDNDCSISIDGNGQNFTAGSVACGDLSALGAATAPSTYECLLEAGQGTKKKLDVAWTFTTNPTGLADWDLVVEGFRSAGANDAFNFQLAKKVNNGVPCFSTDPALTWVPLALSVSSSTQTIQKVKIGPLSPSVICIRAVDDHQTGDSQADTLQLDRVYLHPEPVCADADNDSYPATCSNCNHFRCPLTDCNDNDALSNPGLTEGPIGDPTCSDGRDNDCDLLTDASDTQCGGSLPDRVAVADQSTNPGTIISGSYISTQVSDDGREVLREGLQNNKSKLTHIWRFDGVPAGIHTLRFEAQRPDNAEGDNFQFAWSTDGSSFTNISGALVSTPTETSGGLTASMGSTSSLGSIYIRIQDTKPNGSVLDTVEIDYLVIETD